MSEPDSQIGGLPAECQKLSKGEICRSLFKTCMGKLPSKLKGLIYWRLTIGFLFFSCSFYYRMEPGSLAKAFLIVYGAMIVSGINSNFVV